MDILSTNPLGPSHFECCGEAVNAFKIYKKYIAIAQNINQIGTLLPIL